jgi:hypothetical protein
MKILLKLKLFYWPFTIKGVSAISKEGQEELRDNLKLWPEKPKYKISDIWRRHSDELVRRKNRKLLLPQIGEH